MLDYLVGKMVFMDKGTAKNFPEHQIKTNAEGL